MRILALVALVAGCTEMTDYYPNAETVELDGRKFYVTARPQNGKNVYLAGPNDPKLFEVIYSGDISLPAYNVAAIERVTKCSVIRETVKNIESGITYAAVKCS